MHIIKNLIKLVVIIVTVLGLVSFTFSQNSLRITSFGLNHIAELRLDDFLNPALYPLEITTSHSIVRLKIMITVITSSCPDLKENDFIELISKPLPVIPDELNTIHNYIPFEKHDGESELKNVILEYGGFLPAGEYEFEIDLLDEKQNVITPLDKPEPQLLSITTTQPPKLIYPQNNQTIYESHPNFQWLSVGARPGLKDILLHIKYYLKIAEKFENQTAEEAITQIPFFENYTISETSIGQKTIINFPYPIDVTKAEPLSSGKTYVWQVQAFDDFGRPVGGAHAKSQVFEFSMAGGQNVEIILEFKPQKSKK